MTSATISSSCLYKLHEILQTHVYGFLVSFCVIIPALLIFVVDLEEWDTGNTIQAGETKHAIEQLLRQETFSR